jgi:hypothetical protein
MASGAFVSSRSRTLRLTSSNIQRGSG